MKCDYHVHTTFSDDGKASMNEQLSRACELGLDEICFTEHVDYGIKRDWDDPAGIDYRGSEPFANVNYPEYFKAIDSARDKFRGKITIKSGLEFGVQRHTTGQYEKLFARYRDKLDFVLLSVHQVEDQEFWTQDFQRGRTQAEYNHGYYEELLQVVRSYHDYSVLAHLDLMVRYDHKGVYPFAKVRDVVVEILETAIADGKGIELNTSSWRYGLQDTQPCQEILRLYRDFGGEVLTLGSDAHSPEYVADHMREAREILREIGFRRFCTFEKMKPIYHDLFRQNP